MKKKYLLWAWTLAWIISFLWVKKYSRSKYKKDRDKMLNLEESKSECNCIFSKGKCKAKSFLGKVKSKAKSIIAKIKD